MEDLEPPSPLPFQAKEEEITSVVRTYTGNLHDQRLLDMTLKRKSILVEKESVVNSSANLDALKKNTQSNTVKSMTYVFILKLTSGLFQSLLSLFACLVYVASTYYSDSDSNSGVFSMLEIIIASLFGFDYAFGFWNAKDKKKFLMNFLNLVDLLTILPVVISLLSDQASNGSLAFARIFRILRVIRVMRFYGMFNSSSKNGRPLFESSEVNRQIVITVSTLLAIVFISTGIIHTLYHTSYFDVNLPEGTTSFTFDIALYYIIITTFTIGYGDIYPLNNFSRAIIGLFVICVIVVMSQQTARLSELVKNSSQYRKPYRGERHSHIVLTGSLTGIAVARFLREFYHSDHGTSPRKCQVLLVGEEKPSREILEIMSHPNYDDAVLYLEADFLREDTLLKAQVPRSNGVFILTDQHSQDSIKNDTYAILAAAATKEQSANTPVYVQLVKPEMLVHQAWIGWDMAFSTWKVKIGLLAANAFTPGFSTFICNLITSRAATLSVSMQDKPWMTEYILGLDNELYLVPVPARLVGKLFHDAVEEMYKLKRAILLGVQNKLKDDLYDIFLNPVNYKLREGDKVFVIAKDSIVAQIPAEPGYGQAIDQISDDLVHEIDRIKARNLKRKSHVSLDQRYYAMWEQDLRGLIWDHILIFGRIEYLGMVMETFSYLTAQTICYVTNLPPDKTWQQISRRYNNVLYLQCSLSEADELSHTAINFSYHVLIFSSKVNAMSVEDSGVLPLVRLIEHNFSCHYTVELVNEVNMKYLEQKPLLELSVLKHVLWPRYAASDVFLSSTLDYVLAQGYYNSFVMDFIQRLILFETSMAETGVDENCRVQSIPVPSSLAGKTTFQQLFLYFLNRQRPILLLAVYRAVGPLGNDSPYVLTAPEKDTLLLQDDSLIVLGNTDESAKLGPELKRHDTVRFKGRTRAKAATTILVRKATIADSAVRTVEEEKNEREGQSDEMLLDALREHLSRTRKEREVLMQQNDMIMNLSSEYTTIKQLLLGAGDEDSQPEDSDEEKSPTRMSGGLE